LNELWYNLQQTIRYFILKSKYLRRKIPRSRGFQAFTIKWVTDIKEDEATQLKPYIYSE